MKENIKCDICSSEINVKFIEMANCCLCQVCYNSLGESFQITAAEDRFIKYTKGSIEEII